MSENWTFIHDVDSMLAHNVTRVLQQNHEATHADNMSPQTAPAEELHDSVAMKVKWNCVI